MRQAYQQSHTRRRRCKCCGELFESDCRSKGKQRYCSKNTCQIKRQRHNEQAWRLNNPECLKEQYERTRIWFRGHSDYSRQRRKANPEIEEKNRVQTKVRMRKIRSNRLFDKSKVILTQLAGSKGDNYYLTRGYKWLLVRLTKASLLSKAGLLCNNLSRFKQVANCLPQGRLYELSGVF